MPKDRDTISTQSPCRECEHWASVSERVRVTDVLAKAIGKMEMEIANDQFKATVGDFLKLVQLEKELDNEETKEIRVTWVEPEKAEESSSDE